MVWGCFSYFGVGKLVFIDGIMNAAEYCSILSDNLFASANQLDMNSFISSRITIQSTHLSSQRAFLKKIALNYCLG